jgi:hypothetical protein
MPNKDFGQGFYVTKYQDHAEDWADKMGKKYETQGFVTEFEYTESDFARKICKIKHFEEYNNEWLDFVVMNRDENIVQPAHDYDIVEGPVANDKIQHRLVKFLDGKIPRDKFIYDLSKHSPTHQICFLTTASLQLIKKTSSKEVRINLMDISEPLLGRLIMDRNINEDDASDLFYNSDTFAKLSDASTLLHRKSWQEIYELLKNEISMTT